jgi:hypothetical protein
MVGCDEVGGLGLWYLHGKTVKIWCLRREGNEQNVQLTPFCKIFTFKE